MPTPTGSRTLKLKAPAFIRLHPKGHSVLQPHRATQRPGERISSIDGEVITIHRPRRSTVHTPTLHLLCALSPKRPSTLTPTRTIHTSILYTPVWVYVTIRWVTVRMESPFSEFKPLQLSSAQPDLSSKESRVDCNRREWTVYPLKPKMSKPELLNVPSLKHKWYIKHNLLC